ncbi:MAG: ATP-binding protein [Bacteroidota bacterium]
MSGLSKEYRQRIVKAIRENTFRFRTNKQHAISLGINQAQFSRILNNELDNVISDSKWQHVASKYNVPVTMEAFHWKPAYTAVWHAIKNQLETCQQLSMSAIFCDISDIGKSFTAKQYVSTHRNAILVDCSLHKSRTDLLKAMAKEFGIFEGGTLSKIQKDLIQYMKSMTTPLVILDEFGDLTYPAFLEVKALWNATENRCGWYMMGADGLAVKLDRNRYNKKVGYAEIFSRLGSRYQRVTPSNEHDRAKFLLHEIGEIVKANKSKYSAKEMYAKTNGSLRRVYIEILKEKNNITPVAA